MYDYSALGTSYNLHHYIIYSSEEQTLNLVPTPSNEESNTFCCACISVFSESFWSNPIPFGNIQHMAVQRSCVCAAVWWRRPATNISHLYQRQGNLTVFQAQLQGASSRVPAEHVWFMNNMSVYMISYSTALASHSTSPPALSHIHWSSRYSSFTKRTEVTLWINVYRMDP